MAITLEAVLKVLGIYTLFVLIGMLCSLFPWLYISLVMGLPAVLLNSFILTILYLTLGQKE